VPFVLFVSFVVKGADELALRAEGKATTNNTNRHERERRGRW
jgi:hypothetical protein